MTVGDYKAITDLGELRDVASQMLEEGKPIGFDTETGYRGPDFTGRATDHSHPDQFCVGFSFSNDPTWGRYVPLRHDEGTNISSVDGAWSAVEELLTKGNIVSHNAKFEARIVEKAAGYKIASEGDLIDTMLCVYVLNKWSENGMRPLMDLKGLVEKLCHHKMMHIHELWPDLAANKNSKIRFNTLNADNPLVISYACEDAVWVLPLMDIVYPMAKKERPFMLELEHRIQALMVDVETYGAGIDWDAMELAYAQAQTFVPNMEAWVKQGLSELSGRDVSELNLRSTMQMKQLLYRDIGLETTRMTKAGKDAADKQDWERMSTDEKAMTALSREHPEIRNLLSYREVQNLNQRLKKWTTEYNQASDKRVHANYNQVTVGSGRFAANNPAIQQLPKKWYWSTTTPENETANGFNYWKGNFRDFVVAAPGNYLLTFDLSQAELRMLAGDSQEPALLNAFANDIDVHTITASQMLGKPIESISSEDRAIGKAQPLDSRVLTPTGWRRFGDLIVGDYVIGSDGKATIVTGVFPQGVKEIFKVTTSDGAVAESCGEHYWTVKNANSNVWQTLTLQTIVNKGLHQTSGQAKWRLPSRPVVEYTPLETELPIDPYVLGLLLGDGGFTHDWGASYGSADKELLDAVSSYHRSCGGVVNWKPQGDNFWVGYLASGVRNARNPLTQKLRELGLWMKRGEHKFIPPQYLVASPLERLAILQGLLDTDGSVQYSGGNFRVTSKALTVGIQEIARSLGGQATLSPIAKLSENQLPAWRVQLTLPAQFEPFRLTRKIQKRKPVRETFSTQTIQSVEAVMPAKVQCISVANADGLYVSSDFIVTHNTFNFA